MCATSDVWVARNNNTFNVSTIHLMCQEFDMEYCYVEGLIRSILENISTPRRCPRGKTPWITRAFPRSEYEMTRGSHPASLTLSPDPPRRRFEFLGWSLGQVYLCLQSFVVACCLAGHNAPSPDKCFHIWLTHLWGRASDKRLIFLRANDLHIPDLLICLAPPPSPHLPLSQTSYQYHFFCLFPLLRRFLRPLIAKLRTHRKRSRAGRSRRRAGPIVPSSSSRTLRPALTLTSFENALLREKSGWGRTAVLH